MNIKYFSKKEYSVPLNAPQRTKYKYLQVIDSGYAKYLDIVYHCDGLAMYRQIYRLVELAEGPNKTLNASRKYALKMIKKLESLGFIETSYINQNKFLYLKKPAFALVTGDYKNPGRINLAKDFKNDKFRIAILKMEFFIEHDELLHNKSMFYHLRRITQQIRTKVLESGNRYDYSLEAIDEILKMDDYKEIKEYLADHPEYRYKLDIIRTLWNGLGDIYRKMLLQRETVLLKPMYLKIFISEDGQVILHYIPNIIIFDVSRDKKFFIDKTEKLFKAFFGLEGNALRGIRTAYIKSKRKNMGYEGEHHIGYVLTIVGEDLEVLKAKRQAIDEVVGTSANTPVMDCTNIIALNTGQYLHHVSRRGNKYNKVHNERIDQIIVSKLEQVKQNNEKKRKEKLQKETELLGKDLMKHFHQK